MHEAWSGLVNGAAMLGGVTCLLLGTAALVRHRDVLRHRMTPPATLAGVTLLIGVGAVAVAAIERGGNDEIAVTLRVGGVSVLLAAAGTAWTLSHLARARRRWIALVCVNVGLAAATPFVPGFTPASSNAVWRVFLVVAFATVLTTFVGGAVGLMAAAWRAPGLARDHSRLLATGLLLYSAALPFGTWAYAIASGNPDWAALLFWIVLVPVALAISPPAPVRVVLRRRAAAQRQTSQTRVLEATTRRQALDILLPTLARSLGTRALVLQDHQGVIEWTVGLTPTERDRLASGLPPRQVFGDTHELPTVLPLREGRLIAVPHPLTPHSGVIEQDHLELVAQELDLALLAADRLTALAGERERRAQLETEQDQLDADNAALRAYGRAIAHDIKTPLTVIRGAAETIDRLEELSSAGRDLVDRIMAHSDRMAGMIDEQLQAATDVTENEVVDLQALCRWLRDTLDDELASTRSVLEWSDRLSAVHANRGLLQRVLLNLARNALQHATGAGPITIWVHPGPRGEVLVTDDGTGMDPDDAERIFQAGVRLDHRGAGGLGLADSRAALRRLGGDLMVVDTEPGAGTTLAVVLPGTPAARTTGTHADRPGTKVPQGPD